MKRQVNEKFENPICVIIQKMTEWQDVEIPQEWCNNDKTAEQEQEHGTGEEIRKVRPEKREITSPLEVSQDLEHI